MKDAAGLWRPLRTPIFRQLLIGDMLSDIGTFMPGVDEVRMHRLSRSADKWLTIGNGWGWIRVEASGRKA